MGSMCPLYAWPLCIWPPCNYRSPNLEPGPPPLVAPFDWDTTTWSCELASIIAAGVSEVVKRLQLKIYVMSAYPSQDRTREAAAQAAIRRGARSIDSSSDSSQTESSSNSDSSSDSDSMSSVEELQEEKMIDPEETEGPFTRRLPPLPVQCPVCKGEKEKC